MRSRAYVYALLLTGLLLAFAAPASASLTLGDLAPTTSGTGSCANADYAQLHAYTFPGYSMPETGTITSWSHNATPGGPQQLTLKVLRNYGDEHALLHQVIGLDGPRDLVPGQVNTFAVSIPVLAGDHLDLNAANATTGCTFPTSSLDTMMTRDGYLTLGQVGNFTPVDGSRLNLTAVLEPSNVVTLHSITRDKRNGTATLHFTLPNPGDLILSGKGVTAASSGHARASRYFDLPGAASMVVGAQGSQARTLNQTGKVKLKVRLTYTPMNGAPGTQSLKVKLKKRR